MADQAAKTDETAKKAEAPEAEAPKTESPKAEATHAAPAKAESAKTAAKPIQATAARAEKAAAPAKTRRKPARKAVAARKANKPARKPARTNTANQGAKIMNKQTQNAAETGKVAAEQFRAAFGDVNERAKAAMERSARIVEELADLTRGNVEALVASSKVAAKGVETLSQDAAEYSRKSFEEASAALKGFAEVKSATDFFRLQSDYARGAFDSYVAETARLSENVLKLAGEVAEPITSRYSVAAERVKTLAA